MNATQFAWLYLIENGNAGMEPSFYGGYDSVDDRTKHLKRTHKNLNPIAEIYLKEIKEIGVNWHQTRAPESDSRSVFNGTFCDAGQTEYICGKLVLNNGLEQTWSGDAIEVRNVFEMMAFAADANQRGRELFGLETSS